MTASTISGVYRTSTFGTEPSISFDKTVNRVALAGVQFKYEFVRKRKAIITDVNFKVVPPYNERNCIFKSKPVPEP